MTAATVQVLEVEGLRVLLRRNRAHEVVAARLVFRGGAANTTLATAGVEAMLARTARRGTGRFPKAILNGTMARIGADLGAVATHDSTAFNLRCLRRHFDVAWDVFTDVIVDPLLADDELDLVRRQMLLELRQAHDSPDGALAEVARRLCYGGHPYAADPHGAEESVTVLDAAALRAHAARCWTRANALLVVVGDIDAETLAARAATFARLPAGKESTPLPPRLAYAKGKGQPRHRVPRAADELHPRRVRSARTA
jgi:zinc protease